MAKNATTSSSLTTVSYPDADSRDGLSRATVLNLARKLGLSEVQTIHFALARLAISAGLRGEIPPAALAAHLNSPVLYPDTSLDSDISDEGLAALNSTNDRRIIASSLFPDHLPVGHIFLSGENSNTPLYEAA